MKEHFVKKNLHTGSERKLLSVSKDSLRDGVLEKEKNLIVFFH